jgi:NADPH2:quinone reductase
MRAVTYTRPGDSSVLELLERPTPEPGAGEIRIRLLVGSEPDRLEVTQRRDRRGGRGADGSEP